VEEKKFYRSLWLLLKHSYSNQLNLDTTISALQKMNDNNKQLPSDPKESRFSTIKRILFNHPFFIRTKSFILDKTSRFTKYCMEHFHVIWDPFKAKVEKVFHLTEHSVIQAPRVVIRVSVLLFSLLFLWALIFHIDQVVHAQGQVIADARTQIVQSADGGVLVDIKIKEGELVKEGQVLAIMEKSKALAGYTESYGRVASLRMTVARLQAIILNQPTLVLNERIVADFPELAKTNQALFNQQRQSFKEQIKTLEETKKLTDEELAMNIPLEKMGDVSRADIIRLKRTANEANANYLNQKNKLLQDYGVELNKSASDLMAQEQNLAQQEQLLDHTEIIAPATGIIKNIKITTLGGVLKPGDTILEILPTESNLIIEAKIKPVDMTNITVGLPVSVKLDNYDYSIFGVLNGKVSYVSADTLSEETKSGPFTYYRAKVIIQGDTLNQKSQEINVRPGMTATVDIKTGNRTVFSIIMKPIIKTISESFGER